MSIERTYYCDREGCERHARSATVMPHSILKVTGTNEPTLHFCSWDCLMKHAATIEPPEVIPMGEGSE